MTATAAQRWPFWPWGLVPLLGLAVLTLGVVIVAANPGLAEPDAYSIPMRRVVGLCSAGLDASLIPVMAYLVGIFAWVLNR